MSATGALSQFAALRHDGVVARHRLGFFGVGIGTERAGDGFQDVGRNCVPPIPMSQMWQNPTNALHKTTLMSALRPCAYFAGACMRSIILWRTCGSFCAISTMVVYSSTDKP